MTTVPFPHPEFIAARWHGGPQETKDLKWVVMHSIVCACREGAALATAHYFQRTDRVASAHYCVDPGKVVQCVGDHTVAYHCGHNFGSIAVEMADNPADKRGKKRWDDENHRRTERRAARLVARLTLAAKIRPYFVGKWKVKAGIKGVTTHAVMTNAFHQSTHWDPGAWRRFRFMREVRRQRKLIKARYA